MTGKTGKIVRRSVSDVAAEIEKRSARRAELVARSGVVSDELEKARDAYSRSIAEGTADVAPTRIRELSDEQEGLNRALLMIDREISALEAERGEATIYEARLKAEAAEATALELYRKMHTLLDEFGTGQLIPLAAKLEYAIREARSAEHTYTRTRGEPQPAWLSSVEKTVGNPSAKARTVARVIRAYCEGKSLPVATESPSSSPSVSSVALQ